MAGLLDAQDAALMALGTGLLGGGTFAQALGRGGQGFLSTYAAMQQAAEEKALKERELAMRAQLQAAQIANYESEAAQRKAQAAEILRKQQQAQAKSLALPGFFGMQSAPTVPGDAFMPGAPPEQRPSFDAIGAARSGMFDPEEIKKYHALTQLDTPEVARTIEVDDGKGGKATMQVDKFGRPVGQAMPAYIAPHFQNFGGNTGVFRGSNQIGNFANTQTPDSIANNQVTMRGQNMVDARAREAASREAAPQFNADVGGFIVKPTMQNPNGGVIPLAGYEKKLTEDQAKAAGWLAQAENAYKNILSVTGKNPEAARTGFNDALAAVPSFGLAAGAANMLRSNDRQKFLQASSSLSEALLRAATGAGINEYEAKQKVQELTPQAFDTEENIQQKFDAIPVYLKALRVRAGVKGATNEQPSNPRNPGELGSGSFIPPGTIDGGYRFKGGDPANKANWEKL